MLVGQGLMRVDLIRRFSIKARKYYLWSKQYGGMRRNQLRELRKVQKVNEQLRRVVADLTLDKQILFEIAWRNFQDLHVVVNMVGVRCVWCVRTPSLF